MGNVGQKVCGGLFLGPCGARTLIATEVFFSSKAAPRRASKDFENGRPPESSAEALRQDVFGKNLTSDLSRV